MLQNLVFGGTSGVIATTVIQPIDFIKVQIQVRAEQGQKNLNPISIAKEIISKEGGVLALYKGIDSAWMRQVVYTSIRVGLFYSIKDNIKSKKGREATFFENTLASLLSGAIGSFCGNPFDLALVRMQSDANLPKEERRNYNSVFDAVKRIAKEEGIATLWRGSFPTVTRAVAMNVSMMTSFEEAKKLFKPRLKSDRQVNIASSLISGFCGAFCCLPFDNVKTKIQKMKQLPDGSLPYNGLVDCFKKSIQKEGFAKLWVGFNTFYVRVAPHAITTLLVNEFLRNTFGPNKGKK